MMREGKKVGGGYELLVEMKRDGKVGVVKFGGGGVGRRGDGGLMMEVGGDGVFVGCGMLK